MLHPLRVLRQSCLELQFFLPRPLHIKMLKHAYWSVELPKVKSWELNKPLQKMEGIFGGKASNVRDLCDYYGLSASLIIRVFSEANGMPDLTLSNDALSFWASMNVDVKFDFYLD